LYFERNLLIVIKGNKCQIMVLEGGEKMAKRSRKAERQLEELIKAILIMVAISTYLITSSWTTTIVITCIAVGLILGITIYQGVKRRERIKMSGIQDIDKMKGIEFEHYLKELFRSQGFKVDVTSASGDYGADLVIKKDSKKIVVQAKRYSKSVGVKAIQEVKTSQNHYGANECWVVTNHYFTAPAKTLAQSNNVKLIDREALIDMIVKMNPNAAPLASRTVVKSR
jgi:restriction system protein